MPKCAVFATTRNSGKPLQTWLNYYKRHFAKKDIYILDQETTDGSLSGVDVSIETIHYPIYNDNQWHVDIANNMVAKLLERYQYVLYSHIDEIIVADPAQYPGGLSEYLASNTIPIVRCNGMGVVQNLSLEKEIDWSKPIFDQRRWYYKDIHDCKPLLVNQIIHWAWGFHWDWDWIPQPNTIIERPIDPHLFLVHLHRADLKSMLDRHAWMRTQTFASGQGNAGFHHQWSDEEVRQDIATWQSHMEPIPERFSGLIL